jgi:ABC-type nitrate/sulfonate/bicarbonate transport system permease component
MLTSGELWVAVRDSISCVFVGYIAGTAAGIVTGILLGRLPSLDTSLSVLFEFLKGSRSP